MGDVYVELEVANALDSALARRGDIEQSHVRKETIKALADTGARLLMLPEDLVDTLGLERTEKVVVTYADGRKEARDIAGILLVRVGRRSMHCDCVVGPPGSEPLLGQIILERLDLLVDSLQGKLVARPESPYFPTLNMK